MHKKGQMAGWGSFVALALFLLMWGIMLGTGQTVNTSFKDSSYCDANNRYNATAGRCYNVLSVDNYSGTSAVGFANSNMTAGYLATAGQTTTLTSVGIGVGIIALVLGIIFLVRKSGIM